LRIEALFILLTVVIHASAQDARDIVRRADARTRGNASASRITITTVRPSWSREMTVKAWTQGNDQTLILVTAPVKDKGIVFLRRGREVWNWIPSIERNIKLPPSMMGQSWMGTDFTNDDLVKEASIVDDYVHRLEGEDSVGGRLCHRIRLTPKPEASVVWGRLVMWVDKRDLLMLRTEYYDEADMLVNTLLASDVRMLGGRLLPSRIEMIPADKKGHKTVMTYQELVFDPSLPPQFFTTQQMSKLQ
jgi:outer membrane lipoprotein-sorting protein